MNFPYYSLSKLIIFKLGFSNNVSGLRITASEKNYLNKKLDMLEKR